MLVISFLEYIILIEGIVFVFVVVFVLGDGRVGTLLL
jgi:hypothetical protein